MAMNYDIDEILDLAQRGLPSRFIRDELGLDISVRQVQRLVSSRLGRRPTRAAIKRADVLRDRVVAYMESQVLDPHYCSSCHRYYPARGFIRALNADLSLDVLVFVCARCSVVSDV